MPRIPTPCTLAAGLLAAALALPAAADRLVIDDDGWRMVPDTPVTGRTVIIEDDGWRYADPEPEARVERRRSGAGCTQAEMSIGLRGEACGTLSPAEVTRILTD